MAKNPKVDMAAQIAKAAQDRERRDRMMMDAAREPEAKPAEPEVKPEPEAVKEITTLEEAAVVWKANADAHQERIAAINRGEIPKPEGLVVLKKKSADSTVVQSPALPEPVPSQPAEPEAPHPEPSEPEMAAVVSAVAPERPVGRKKHQPSREETVAITVHFPRVVRQNLRIIAGETDRQLQDVIAEGLNMVLKKHGKPALAPREAKR